MSLRVRDHFRAHGRQRVNLAATLRRSAPDEGSSEALDSDEVRVRDIGLGGACIEINPRGAHDVEAPRSLRTPGFLRAEAPVVLEVVSPTLWDPIVLRGKVAWLRGPRGTEPARFGVRFEHADQGGLFALFQLLGAHGIAR